MRIAVITTSFPSGPGDPSGHFVRAACERLSREGHEVHVIAPGGSLLDAPSASESLWLHPAGGGPLFRFPGAIANAKQNPPLLLHAGAFAAGARVRLLALRRRGRIDHLIAHWIVPCAWPLLAWAPEASLLVHAHGADVRFLLSLRRGLREAILEHLLNRGARFCFAAQTLLDTLSASLNPAKAALLHTRAHVELPAMDMPALPGLRTRGRALRASLHLPAAQPLAICVGRLIEGKRIELALSAAASSHAHLLIAGDGPLRPALTARALELRCQATFLGMLPRDEALSWLSAADLLLHPSREEAAPTVVREARALQVPVMACDAGDVGLWAERDRGICAVSASEFEARAAEELLGLPEKLMHLIDGDIKRP